MRYLFLFFALFIHRNAFAKSYTNFEDAQFTIRNVFIEKFTDNLNEIYSVKANQRIQHLIELENQWLITTSEKEADVIIKSKLIKNPKNLNLKMSFVFRKTTDLFITDTIEIENIFETEKILTAYEKIFLHIKSLIPYQGIVLSRIGDQVTLNLGKYHGISETTDVLAVLITKLNRHPKSKIFISSEKEIIGKIAITKADDYLSFGKIIYERSENAISKNTKLEFSKISLTHSTAESALIQRTDAAVIVGNSPQEWTPKPDPQYGSVSISGGLIQYTQNLNFLNDGSKTVGQWLTPTIKAEGELWIVPEFHVDLLIRQTSLKLNNPSGDSVPGAVNMSLSQYQIKAIYNYELDSSYRSPQFQTSVGIGQFQASSDVTAPITISSLSYGGMFLGFKGKFPVSDEVPIDLALYFNYFFTRTLRDSANADYSGIQINDFGAILKYIKSKNISYFFELSFEYYSSDFDSTTGSRIDPVDSISHRLINTLAGIEYSF